MSDFGKRLQFERKMLGFSQTKFAEACGIKRTAQTTYESGERFPDVAYLEEAGKLGVDVSFLLTGDRVTYDHIIRNGAMSAVLYRLQESLGISHNELELLISEGESSLRALKSSNVTKEDHFPEHASMTITQWVKEAISKHPVEINSTLLVNILEGLDLAQGDLSPAKKANAAAILYHAFASSGKIDQRMIEATVKLAS